MVSNNVLNNNINKSSDYVLSYPLFSIFRKWTRRVTLSLCLDGHPWEVWIHLQGSSDLNGEIMSRHQKWGPMLGYSRKSLGLYELQVENHQTLIWETYSSKDLWRNGRNTPKNCIFWKYIVGGLLLHPGAGWGLLFWTMSFYNPKKFISRSF